MTKPPLRRAEHCIGKVAEAPASAPEKSYWSSAITEQSFSDLKVWKIQSEGKSWGRRGPEIRRSRLSPASDIQLVLGSCGSFSWNQLFIPATRVGGGRRRRRRQGRRHAQLSWGLSYSYHLSSARDQLNISGWPQSVDCQDFISDSIIAINSALQFRSIAMSF